MFNGLKNSCLSLLAALPLLVCGQAPTGPGGAPLPQGQNPKGMHVYIWTGLKSHGEGKHDYPQFLADWSKVLTEHGAVVDGALHAPSAADCEIDLPPALVKLLRDLRTRLPGTDNQY